MAYSDVRKALRVAAYNFLISQSFSDSDIQWENENFSSAGKTQWASVSFSPVQPFLVTLGSQGRDRLTGFLQIDFSVIKGLVNHDFVYDYVDAARQYFKTGFSFSDNNQNVIIESCGAAPAFIVDNSFKIPISIEFRADIPRTTP